jgi:2,3-bisphosphoglycerate-independent phosphoglycerate mutase
MKDLVVAVTCDHSTPVEDKGHSDDPVPYLAIGGKVMPDGSKRFTERTAAEGSLATLEKGSILLDELEQFAA